MNNFIIDVDMARKPHNSHLTLSLEQLQQIMPLIRAEMMQGLVSTEGTEKVKLYLNLDPVKILQINRLAGLKEKNVA